MKKHLIQPLIVFVLTSFFLNAQGTQDNLNKNLYLTCKTWGFVKYFHSEIAAGNVDWDQQLIDVLQGIKAETTTEEFNQLLLKMINSAGEMKKPTTELPFVPDSLKYNLQLDWIFEANFSESIVAALDTIKNRFRPQDHYLVGHVLNAGNPTFDKDSAFYSGELYPDKEHRLLALFRYWNIINYFNPYKYMLDQNWDSTLVEFIPKIGNATDAISYHLSFLELVTRINDTHAYTSSSVIRENIIGPYYLPLKLKFIENQTVITATNTNSNIKVGDVIKKIDGEDIISIRNNLKKYVAGSNETVIHRGINRRIIAGHYENVQLTLASAEGEKTVSVNRQYTHYEYNDLFQKTSPIWEKMVTDSTNYGYVDMGRLGKKHIDQMFSDLWQTDGIIFDIRNYPNGTMWDMIKYLYTKPIHIASFTLPDKHYPGTLKWIPVTIGTGDFSETYENPIYILFDEDTQSQAEYTVMGFEQHPKAVKVGSQTAGADGNVSKIYLPGGILTYFTGLGTYYPDHTETQRIGIVPDIEVYPTLAGIRDGRDEVLEVVTKIATIDESDRKSSAHIFQLLQNYPNPFNSKTIIEYQLSEFSQVELGIYNLLGQTIVTLVSKKQMPGNYEAVWDATGFANGIYFYRLETDPSTSSGKGFSKTRKLVVLK